jgi:hypothetical protein
MPVDTTSGASPVLNDARNRQLDLFRELRLFKAERDLDRSANYPASIPLHFAIVAVVIIVEALANMYLFAQGNELGLLGGIFEAFLLSIVNVGVSVVVGMLALPHLNVRGGIKRQLALLALVFAVVFAVLFNLTAAHYRDLLVQSKTIALEQAIPHAFGHPFALSFNGLVLMILGLVVSALGLWKGYSSDDPYPGYGKLTRKYEEAKETFKDLREQHPDASYLHPGVED